MENAKHKSSVDAIFVLDKMEFRPKKNEMI